MTIDDIEVVNVMMDGADKICDYAINQWISDKYGTSQETRQENIARWNLIRQRARELGRLLKKEMK